MIHLDVRGLPPCEPFDRILAAIDTLPADEQLEVLIHREPFPLYEWLRDHGMAYQTECLHAEQYRITIQHAEQSAPSA